MATAPAPSACRCSAAAASTSITPGNASSSESGSSYAVWHERRTTLPSAQGRRRTSGRWRLPTCVETAGGNSMDKRILAAAIGIVTAATLAVVAPASYAAEVVEITSPTTTRHYYVPPSTTTYYYAPPSTTTYATTTYTPPLTSYYYEPTVVEVRTAPAITVEAPVLTEDQAITEDVV